MERSGNYEPDNNFINRVQRIINRPLTVETVDKYAYDALNDLVQVVEEVVTVYETQPVVWQSSAAEHENAALSYYGIESIGELLDHIAEKAEQLAEIDRVIEQVETTASIFVPPDYQPGPDVSVPSLEHREQPKRQPRLKTLLFVLANEFGIEPGDDTLQIRCGEVDASMMRREPYYEVRVPSCGRTVLICDEYGNATFVFDTTRLPGSEQVKLTQYTKSQLGEIITQHPEYGVSVRCDDQFVPRLVEALASGLQFSLAVDRQACGNYLNPHRKTEKKNGFTVFDIKTMFSVKYATIAEIAAELEQNGVLGEVTKRRWHGEERPAFNAAQVELIRQELERRGRFNPPPPEDHLTARGISIALGVGDISVKKIINRLKAGGELSDGIMCCSPQLREYFSPEQQAVIAEEAYNNGLLTPPPPEGYITVGGAMEHFGVCRRTIQNAVRELSMTLTVYKFPLRGKKTKVCEGISPEQLETIRNYFFQKGYMRLAPEGYKAISQLSRDLHHGIPVLKKAISELMASRDVEFGEPLACRARTFNGAGPLGDFFSPQQQEMIVTKLGN